MCHSHKVNFTPLFLVYACTLSGVADLQLRTRGLYNPEKRLILRGRPAREMRERENDRDRKSNRERESNGEQTHEHTTALEQKRGNMLQPQRHTHTRRQTINQHNEKKREKR